MNLILSNQHNNYSNMVEVIILCFLGERLTFGDKRVLERDGAILRDKHIIICSP